MKRFSYTYQKSQKHGHCFDAIVVVVGFDEDGDRITGKEMRYREADGPANNKREYCINNYLKLSHGENVLVHDQNRRFNEPEPNNGDHVESELGLQTSG
jgi:hypothetical protein